MKTFETLFGKAFNADCFEVMTNIPNESVDMILADLPYGTTSCKWDKVIPFEPMWKELKRIIKPNGAMVFTASQPFTSALVMSNYEAFKYEWIWKKSRATDFPNAKNKPMRGHENILVFSLGTTANGSSKKMCYHPQFHYGSPYVHNSPGKRKTSDSVLGKGQGRAGDTRRITVSDGRRYPVSVVDFANPNNKTFHPTQKPVALFEYLIKTYTHPGELVFDPTAGSLTTGVAAEGCNRQWICCEKEEDYFLAGRKRFESTF